MFQTGFPSDISSSKLHIQRQVFVRPGIGTNDLRGGRHYRPRRVS